MTTQHLTRSGGTLSYDVRGEGPLVVCSPGFGDLRSTYAPLTAGLAEAGFRAAAVDLRGHGGSSTGWRSYAGADVAGDLLALAGELDERPAVLLGNSYSADAAVLAAVRAPDRVAGLVLTGPFVRDPQPSMANKILFWLASRPGLGRMLWKSFWPRLFGQHKPADFDARRAELMANMAESGRFDAVRAMMRGTHAPADAVLSQVRCPVLIVMGVLDPDFPDPAAEAQYVAAHVGGRSQVLMVPEAGHYPHYERAEIVLPEVLKFLHSLDAA